MSVSERGVVLVNRYTKINMQLMVCCFFGVCFFLGGGGLFGK